MNSLVYEQWLLADLHELHEGSSCLPQDITTAQKYQLTGAFTLQVSLLNDL